MDIELNGIYTDSLMNLFIEEYNSFNNRFDNVLLEGNIIDTIIDKGKTLIKIIREFFKRILIKIKEFFKKIYKSIKEFVKNKTKNEKEKQIEEYIKSNSNINEANDEVYKKFNEFCNKLKTGEVKILCYYDTPVINYIEKVLRYTENEFSKFDKLDSLYKSLNNISSDPNSMEYQINRVRREVNKELEKIKNIEINEIDIKLPQEESLTSIYLFNDLFNDENFIKCSNDINKLQDNIEKKLNNIKTGLENSVIRGQEILKDSQDKLNKGEKDEKYQKMVDNKWILHSQLVTTSMELITKSTKVLTNRISRLFIVLKTVVKTNEIARNKIYKEF